MIKTRHANRSHYTKISNGNRVVVTDVHLHHIIPKNQIKKMIRDSQSEPMADRKRHIEAYINLPHIKPLVETAMVNRIRSANSGQLLHAALSFNPYNLLPGPAPRFRSDNGGADIDMAMVNRQSNDFLSSLQQFQDNPSFQTFGQIREAQPVDYLVDPHIQHKFLVA
jgi:hypothetical protein